MTTRTGFVAGMTAGQALVIALVGSFALGVAGVQPFTKLSQPILGSAVGDQPSGGDKGLVQVCKANGIPLEQCATSGDINVRANNLGNEDDTDLATNAKLYNGDGSFVASSGITGDGTRTTFSDLVVGERYTVQGYNGSSVCNPVKNQLLDQASVRESLDCWQLASAGDHTVTFFNENGASTSSVSIGSGGQQTLDKVTVRLGAEHVASNPSIIAFNTTELDAELRTDDPIVVSGAEKVDVPDHLSNDFTVAYRVFDAGKYLNGDKPLLEQFETAATSSIEIFAASGSDPAGDLEVAVVDSHLYKANDGSTKQAVEDDSNSDIGVGDVTATLTVN